MHCLQSLSLFCFRPNFSIKLQVYILGQLSYRNVTLKVSYRILLLSSSRSSIFQFLLESCEFIFFYSTWNVQLENISNYRPNLLTILSMIFFWKMFLEHVFCILQNGRISSMDFHKATNYLVTASDDESIRLYDVQNAMYAFSSMLSS